MSPRSIEEERDDTMSRLYRKGLPRNREVKVREFDPYAGNMENRDHFRNFIDQVLAGHLKSINFLKKMPASRKAKLKEIHARSGLSLYVLDLYGSE